MLRSWSTFPTTFYGEVRFVRYSENKGRNNGEMRMGGLDSPCAEAAPVSEPSHWQSRNVTCLTSAVASSNESANSSDDSLILIPPSPVATTSKRRICESESNSPKRRCWSSVEDEVEDEADSPVFSNTTSTTYDPTDLDFREITLTEDMLHQDSQSPSSRRVGENSPSTEDEEEVPPLRPQRRSFGRTILISSDDSDVDPVLLSSPHSSGSSNSVHRSTPGRRIQYRERPTSTRCFSHTSSSSGERSGGTAFQGRRCRHRSFSGKKHSRVQEEESSSCSSQSSVVLDPLALQQDVSAPLTSRMSRIFSSRRYHHLSPRARREERMTNQGAHPSTSSANIFSGSPPFRRDDPGRRPLIRSSHPSQGHRVAQPSSPPTRDNYRSNYMPDSDESTEFFTASSSQSENEVRRRRRIAGSPPQNRRDSSVTFGLETSARVGLRMRRRRPQLPVSEVQVSNENSDEDGGITFGNFSPSTFHPLTGRRQRRGTRSRRRHVSSERDISSPDPVQQVRQMEEDERMARLLQAQFDSELQANQPPPAVVNEAPPNFLVDLESSEGSTASGETSSYSSESSASSSGRNEDLVASPNSRRLHRNASGNWRRRGASQRNVQNGRRARMIHPPIDILTLIAWHSGTDDYEALWDMVQVVGDVAPRGLIPQQLNRLPTRHFGEGEVKTKECQVCLSEFEKQDLLRILPCFHEFHAACIDKWLPMNRTCPVCRAEVEVD